MKKILTFAVLMSLVSHGFTQKAPENLEQFEDDIVVADAVFRGVYVGIVRMIQKVSDGDSGSPNTKVLVRLKYANSSLSTNKHMWHVEHDPITGVACAEKNTHFAPFGIQKWDNYTIYCSSVTPDYCEVGDISTKTTLTSVGKNVLNWYNVPNLPIVGPQTVIGHSVNIHGGNMSKQRKACANIQLNERMTPAKVVKVKVKVGTKLDVKLVEEARARISSELGIPLRKVQTAGGLNANSGCTELPFLIYGWGTYSENILSDIQNGKRSIGSLSPVGCTIDGNTIKRNEPLVTCGEDEKEKENDEDWRMKTDDEDSNQIVADAVFRGVYVGIVRMIQKVTASKDGFPVTKVIVRVNDPANDLTSINHMWHVEHDPIANVSCADKNKHFAPFGIQKWDNYTTYCSQNTPDYCEIGDISTKTTLTSLGKDVVNQYGVPLLPLVGPSTVIGHSVNIHGGAMSKVRKACANIILNERMTNAKIVSVPVKFPATLNNDDLNFARIKISKALKFPLSKIHTAERFDMVATGCTKLKFLLFNGGSYCPKALNDLKNGDIDIGILTPKGCNVDRNTGTTDDEGNGSGLPTSARLLLPIALTLKVLLLTS